MAKDRAELLGISPFFIVREHRESVDYYRDKLGFEPIIEVPEDGPFFAVVRRGMATIAMKAIARDVLPVPNHSRHEWARWDAFVDTPDPDLLHKEYCEQGVTIHRPVADTEDGLRAFEIQDINGYVLCFGRPSS